MKSNLGTKFASSPWAKLENFSKSAEASPYIAVYPVLFAAFFVLFFYVNQEMHYFPFDNCLPSLMGSVIVATMIWGGAAAWLKDANRGALVSFLLVLFFYSFIILEPFVKIVDLYACSIFLWIVYLALILAMYFTIRTKRNYSRLSRELNKIALLLILVEVIVIGSHEYRFNMLAARITLQDTGMDVQVSAPTQPPDIYYIILDACASERTMKNLLGYDSSPFTKFLESKGFIVAKNSHSNYAITELSVPSFLNLSYLSPDLLKDEGDDYTLNNRLTRDSRIAQIVKRCGYKFINIGSGFGPTSFIPVADENKEPTLLNECTVNLLQKTPLGFLAPDFLLDQIRSIRVGQFERLDEVVQERSPKFVFMHILLPHPPYLFDAQGGSVRPTPIDWTAPETERARPYVGQAQFAQIKIRHFVEKVLSGAPTPPLIIIHGDHGSATTATGYEPNATETYIRERMGIFNAYYLPGLRKDVVYDTITPVNTLRIVLNNYFHGHYPLLPDRSYMSSYLTPFKLTEVTDKLVGH